MQNFIASFKSFFKANSNPVLITSHKQADPDALGAALVVKEVLQPYSKSDIQIVFPTQSKLTEKLVSIFQLKNVVVKTLSNLKPVDLYTIVLVDTNQPDITDLQLLFSVSTSLDAWNNCGGKIILDHHLPTNVEQESINASLIVPEVNSASALAYKVFLKEKLIPSNVYVLKLALIGILFDTRRLVLADSRIVFLVADLLDKLGGSTENYLQYLESEKDYSERIANLKAGQRNKVVFFRDKYIVSLSFVSSFESSSARSLQYLGSDLAGVINRGKEEIRISFRSTKKFYEQTNIHCGELARYIAKIYSGTGSGHTTAAGSNIGIASSNNEIFETIIKYIENNIPLI